jgi:hypothetical protein
VEHRVTYTTRINRHFKQPLEFSALLPVLEIE